MALLVAGVLVAPAPAAGACATPGRAPDHTLTSAEGHFTVSYYTDVDGSDTPCADYSTETDAGDIAAYAERAYANYTSWGYPAPAGPIDITVTNLAGPPSIEAYAQPGVGITLATPTQIANNFVPITGLSLADEEQKAVANQVFVMFEFATWVPASWGDYWLIDSAAQWAAFQSIGTLSGNALTTLGPPDIGIDCRDDLSDPAPPFLPFRMCDPDRWTEQGYTRWAFYQLLANDFGTSFVHNVLVNGAAGQPALTALENAIAAKGSSLSSVYNDYAKRLLNGDFGVAAIAKVRPPAEDAVVVGTLSATLPVVKVPVNHLAARYVTFQRGDGDGSHPCFAATLSINVAMPAGTSSQPYWFWDMAGETPQALSVNGSTASITVPWDTCFWGDTRGWLSIPNAGTTVDGADFTVTSSVTVDPNTSISATSPPPPVTTWGTTVPVPTTDVAPSIDVFGPELLQVSAASPTIRLIVQSSGPGTVNAALGTTVLGSGSLRAGNNDLRFSVPKSLLGSLRRSASATNLLTLTPMSPSGALSGSPVLLHVAIAAAPKAKKKAKAKAKAKPKK
ncbi:MAG: hypothetical protein ACRDLE_11710 [Gaiellaceae bacterium]